MFFFFVAILLISCTPQNAGESKFRSWEQIKSSDTLIVGTVSSPLTYFFYKGQEMGPEFEKVKAFVQENKLKLKVNIVPNVDSLMTLVERGLIDLSITPMGMTSEARERVSFCGGESAYRIVLVQKESDSLILQPNQLAGRTIYVQPGSPEELRLNNINTEIGGGIDIRIVESDTLQMEEIMKLIAEDSIPLTATDERTAKINKTYFRGLNTDTPLSFPIPMAWFLAKGNNDLQEQVDKFFSSQTFNSYESQMVKRYYEENKWLSDVYNDHNVSYAKNPGDLSPFDLIFKNAAKHSGIDWQLLAAIAYHESRFRPHVKGWSGARGLMGIMPATGRAYGISVEQLMDPEKSVFVAVSLLKVLKTYFKSVPDKQEALKLTLASYNAGHGHIFDAQRLAEKYGEDKNYWDPVVRKYVLLKSNPQYYNDFVCKSGYLRGVETVAYVDHVMEHYQLYKQHFK